MSEENKKQASEQEELSDGQLGQVQGGASMVEYTLLLVAVLLLAK
jgi:hypothetical protein